MIIIIIIKIINNIIIFLILSSAWLVITTIISFPIQLFQHKYHQQYQLLNYIDFNFEKKGGRIQIINSDLKKFDGLTALPMLYYQQAPAETFWSKHFAPIKVYLPWYFLVIISTYFGTSQAELKDNSILFYTIPKYVYNIFINIFGFIPSLLKFIISAEISTTSVSVTSRPANAVIREEKESTIPTIYHHYYYYPIVHFLSDQWFTIIYIFLLSTIVTTLVVYKWIISFKINNNNRNKIKKINKESLLKSRFKKRSNKRSLSIAKLSSLSKSFIKKLIKKRLSKHRKELVRQSHNNE